MPVSKPLKRGMVLRHHSGRVYTVIGVSNTEHPSDKFPVTANYLGANGAEWSRPASEVQEKFDLLYDGTQLAP